MTSEKCQTNREKPKLEIKRTKAVKQTQRETKTSLKLFGQIQ